ncbi:MAG: hypothetical protein RR762_15570 [Glutamicibacter sp.]|uniref:hypothetical protein n=1 Tax=Glutamicibacter sp. TaxID=1931995 RepID=UPI002FCB55D8
MNKELTHDAIEQGRTAGAVAMAVLHDLARRTPNRTRISRSNGSPPLGCAARQ